MERWCAGTGPRLGCAMSGRLLDHRRKVGVILAHAGQVVGVLDQVMHGHADQAGAGAEPGDRKEADDGHQFLVGDRVVGFLLRVDQVGEQVIRALRAPPRDQLGEIQLRIDVFAD